MMTRDEAAQAWQAIAQTPDGALAINYLVAMFGFTRRSTFSSDHAEMALREGQRSVVQHIGMLLELQISPELEMTDDRDDSDPFKRSEPDTYGPDGD